VTTFRADSSRPVVILGAGVQVLTLIGSKLTTCREVAELILDEGSQKPLVRSDSRIVPGGKDWPDSPDAIKRHLRQLSAQYDLTETLTLTVWSLIENRFDELAWFLAEPDRRSPTPTFRSMVDPARIRHEVGRPR
jgi:glycerol-3-phosphate dehydrogenase